MLTATLHHEPKKLGNNPLELVPSQTPSPGRRKKVWEVDHPAPYIWIDGAISSSVPLPEDNKDPRRVPRWKGNKRFATYNQYMV